MTFEVAFKRLKEKFNNVDPALLDDMAIQITMSDEDCGGTFYAAVKDHVLSVEPYDYKDNDAVIDITRKTLAAILDGKMTFDKAVEKGEATLMGNLGKIAAVKDAIKVPAKAEKKTTKKAETKATTAKKTTKTVAAAKKAEAPKAKKTTAKKTTKA